MTDGLRGVECPTCGRMWTAVYYKEAKALKCPDCGTMVDVPEHEKEQDEKR